MVKRYERFKAWLASHPADDIAGAICVDDACPIARFLGEEGKFTHVSVGREKIVARTREQRKCKRVELWMRDFITLFDRLGTVDKDSGTYAECMAIVEGMDQDYAKLAE